LSTRRAGVTMLPRVNPKAEIIALSVLWMREYRHAPF
jgi:hypothetical protein